MSNKHRKSVTENEEKKGSDVVPYTPNPEGLNGAPDLSMLVYMEMKNVLFNCEWRYCKMPRKHCYTSVSTILLAINPYERLPIYGQDVIDEFHEAQKKGRLPAGRPHPYGVSARAYLRMIQRRANQSVIVCGESGAGKTETTKLLMRYLAMTSPSTNPDLIVEQQIVAASPILEAYGNAKTVMNNNSSRFGKFTKLLYDVPDKAREGHILGSYLETYLLEKSRVVSQANNERNYHIPYFLYQGLPKEKHAEFGILDPQQWHYANQGGVTQVPGVNDVDRYKELVESLKLMRVDESTQAELWYITSGVFNLGNIEFTNGGDGFAKIAPKSSKSVSETARLWGIEPAALEKRLTTSTMRVRGKSIEKKLTVADAGTNRDSIAKGIYENLFLYLCKRINAELYQTDEEDVKSIFFIGILDVFGFENFWMNSLEQFCINFTNEKLQQFFNQQIIQSEQEEYMKESVFWKPLSVPDNLEYIRMIEHKDYGFYKLLDSACKAPKPSAEAFMQELFDRHGTKQCIRRVTKPGSGNARGKPTQGRKGGRRRGAGPKFDGFEIKHFADVVSYDASKFIPKNMEAVHPDTAKMMKKSSNVLLVSDVGGNQRGSTGRRNKKSVTAVFHGGIRTLMKNLHHTEPYFVRCVNPNMQKSSTVWDEKVVEHQLRCGGLVEALKVLSLGYPTRVPYSTLYERYHGNVTNPLIKNMGPEAFSTALLIAFDVSENDYELGLTKIFFKPSKAAVLDTIMAQAGQPLSPEQNDKITKYLVQKRVKQMVGACRAFLALRKRVRLARAQSRWRFAGRVAGLLGGTVCNHLAIARKQIAQRKQLQAAMAMQAFFRASRDRSQFLAEADRVKEAVKVVWTSYRRQRERVGLQQWLDRKVAETRQREAERLEREAELERLRTIEVERQKAMDAAGEKQKAEEKASLAAEQMRQEEIRMQVAEQQRLEQVKKQQDELTKQRAKDKELQKEKERQQQLEQEQILKIETENRKAAQRDQAAKLEKEREQVQKEAEYKKRRARDVKIKRNQQVRKQKDIEIAETVEADIIRQKFPEQRRHDTMYDGMDYEEEDLFEEDVEDDVVWSLKESLRRFNKIAQTGHLFLKHAGQRRRKPQDRIVKVSFDNAQRPKEISWGSGSRYIPFDEILFVAWGHWTPAFEARRNTLDRLLCFSVVGREQILDLQAPSKEIAELWVKGLRKMIGHSDEQSNRMAEQAKRSGNLPGTDLQKQRDRKRKAQRQAAARRDSLMKIQQDLFLMTTTTVFRNLEEERIWSIDQSVRDLFAARRLYQIALQQDIPWRQWNHWIREQIVTYLRENHRVQLQYTNQGKAMPAFAPQKPQQQMLHQQMPHRQMPHQQMPHQQMPHQQMPPKQMPLPQQQQMPRFDIPWMAPLANAPNAPSAPSVPVAAVPIAQAVQQLNKTQADPPASLQPGDEQCSVM